MNHDDTQRQDQRDYPSVSDGNEEPSELELTEIQALTWALIDDQITPEQLETLQSLLVQCPKSRAEYLNILGLHFNLQALLGDSSAPILNPSMPNFQQDFGSGVTA